MFEKEEGAVWDEGRALNLETLLILQKVNNFRHHCSVLFKIDQDRGPGDVIVP